MLTEVLVGLYDYVSTGGTVMIPIMLCSMLLWCLSLERLFAFYRLEQDDLSLDSAISMIRRGDCGPNQAGVRRDLVRFLAPHTPATAAEFQGLLQQYRLQTQPKLDKRIGLIATLAAIAPLLGLLGTVNGMIATFDVIALFGTGNAKAMAGGISESLITTQSGLTVAIPGMFLGVILNRRARRLSQTLNETISLLQRSSQ
ncbi:MULTISPECIES: MotA/TolQ/ExbB proton channel family protein [Ferrimonas]|uniref:MotA/TolQ/ExbB proton channel family protein n=1 Tax=Ferrimonas TaxID=44011 RepID=UPI0004841CCD|nr:MULTISPECIES: MotA/TolQ/ExbB proton channel family protein [Ferrimonas]USD38320.1 MotA/TolQ/ExbB proton channel family protein [Ferrimonas sp. SCSIO 43195]